MQKRIAATFQLNGLAAQYNRSAEDLASSALRYLERCHGDNPDRQDKTKCINADKRGSLPGPIKVLPPMPEQVVQIAVSSEGEASRPILFVLTSAGRLYAIPTIGTEPWSAIPLPDFSQ